MNDSSNQPINGFDEAYASEQIRRSQSSLRRIVKKFYLNRVLARVDGPGIDFGCGAGQVLRRLPSGSIGIELNPFLVQALRSDGLDVKQAKGDLSDFDLLFLEPGQHKTLVISHVLEHLPDPKAAIVRLLQACTRIGVTKVIAVVPGARGYASDPTHKTFIDRDFIERNLGNEIGGYSVLAPTYFPGPWEFVGHYFIFHEMLFVLDCSQR